MYYNRFEHNLWQALVGGDETNDANAWHGNYWDDYQGFDRNGDGVGDIDISATIDFHRSHGKAAMACMDRHLRS